MIGSGMGRPAGYGGPAYRGGSVAVPDNGDNNGVKSRAGQRRRVAKVARRDAR